MIEFRLLGSLDLKGSEGKTLRSVLAQPKRVALLAYLAVARPNGYHRRDKLLGLFWPESDQEHGRSALRKALYRLRQSLGEEVIVGRGDEEIGLAEGAVWCDAVAFEETLETGDPEQALKLYRGDLLEGFYISDAPEFERWLEGERERLRRRAAEAAWALADGEETAGNGPAAEKWARWALTFFPNDESAFRRLLELLDRLGNRTGAIEEFEAFARRSQEEYEAEPSPETQALIAAIRRRVLPEPEGAVSNPRDTGPAQRSASPGAIVSAAETAATSEPMVETAGPGRRTRIGRLRGTVAAAVMILILVASAVIVPRVIGPDAQSPPASTHATSGTRVAVFPFNVPANEEFSDLGEGLMEVLGAALDGAGELHEVDPYAVLSQVRRLEPQGEVDIEKARGIARGLGASHFVLGRLLDLRGTVRISASLYSLADDSTWQSDHAGPLEELIGLVNAMARDLLVHLDPVRGEFAGSVRGVSTTSYTALRAYLRGQAFLRRLQRDSARVQYEAAVQEDSTFALAWLRLAEAEEWLDMSPDVWLGTWQRAHDLRARLNPRNRAYLAMGYAYAHGDGPGAERAARAYVTAYPDAVEGWRSLGDILRQAYAWQLGRNTAPEAETAFQRALALDAGNRLALHGLATVAYVEGRKARGDSLWKLVSPYGTYRVPPEDSLERARYFARLGRFPVGAVWLTCWLTDSLTDAARIATLLTDTPRPASQLARGHHLAAWVDLARGQWRTAQTHFGQADLLEPGMGVVERAWFSTFPFFEIDSATLRAIRDSLDGWTPAPAYGSDRRGGYTAGQLPRWLVPHAKDYALGLLSARLGDADATARYAERLEGTTEPADSIALLHDLALEVRALTAAERGDWQEALARLAQAELKAETYSTDSPFKRRQLGRFLRAEALLQLGRDQEALGWFSTLGWQGDESVLHAHVLLREGEIYERLGDAGEAVRHYRRFVARWWEADSEYQPLVADVQARIARLTGDRHAEPNPDAGSR